MSTSSDATQRPPMSRWLVDAGGGIGLVLALALVAAFDRGKGVEVEAPVVDASFDVPPLPELPPLDSSVLATLDVPPPPPPLPPNDPEPPPAPQIEKPGPLDLWQAVNIGFVGGTRTFGVTAKLQADSAEKRLTLNQFGQTNQTMVSVDDNRALFFDASAGRVVQDLTSEGKTSAEDSTKVTDGRKIEVGMLGKPPWLCRWSYGGVEFEQWIDIERGDVSGRLDTFRIRYKMTNRDRVEHTAGLRLLLDTFIGTNDGVPFYIPGRQDVVDKPLVLKGDEVPETVLALEKTDLSDKEMTVVKLGFGQGNEERPGMLALTQWPGSRAVAERFTTEQWRAVENVPWAWSPARSFEHDSAAGIFYLPRALKPGESQTVSFTYGLGSLSSGSSSNASLSLQANGPFTAGQKFWVSAFVKRPTVGQTVRLTLPKGLTLANRESEEKSIPAGGEIAKVDWLVRIDPNVVGKQDLKAELVGRGITEKSTVNIDNAKPVVQVLITGNPLPGGRARVTAQLLNHTPGASVRLELPRGLKATSAEEQKLGLGPVGQASWVVDVEADFTGEADVAVRMMPGNIVGLGTVSARAGAMSLPRVVISDLPRAGSVFRVTAQVLFPSAGATARIDLPQGLQLYADESAGKSMTAGALAQPSWLVKAERGAGPDVTVSVRLNPGSVEASQSVRLLPPQTDLVVRLGKDQAALSEKPFWVVADISNPPASASAELVLPPGFRLAPGHNARKPLASADTAQAMWPVIASASAAEMSDLTVRVPGVGEKSVTVRCARSSLIER